MIQTQWLMNHRKVILALQVQREARVLENTVAVSQWCCGTGQSSWETPQLVCIPRGSCCSWATLPMGPMSSPLQAGCTSPDSNILQPQGPGSACFPRESWDGWCPWGLSPWAVGAEPSHCAVSKEGPTCVRAQHCNEGWQPCLLHLLATSQSSWLPFSESYCDVWISILFKESSKKASRYRGREREANIG